MSKLFTILQAGGLKIDEMVETFVPTKSYRRLLVPTHQIVMGSRGSGKTTLVKMLSHENMAALAMREGEELDRVRELIDCREFIAIYMATDLRWVGSLKNKPWPQGSPEAERAFLAKVNLTSCLAFLRTLPSLIASYVPVEDALRFELDFVRRVARLWGCANGEVRTVADLREALHLVEALTGVSAEARRVLPGAFPHPMLDTELLSPLQYAMEIADDLLDLPSGCHWVLCIDAVEFLSPQQQRTLNSFMRAGLESLALKLTTLPYHHAERETHLNESPLLTVDDFGYVYIDTDPIATYSQPDVVSRAELEENLDFPNMLFRLRAEKSGLTFAGLDLLDLLGQSELLDAPSALPREELMALVKKYASEKTLARVRRLQSSPKDFGDQAGRKLSGALRLRRAVEDAQGGELDIYHGASMYIRCTDYNPRRMVQLFGQLLEAVNYQLPGPETRKRPPYMSKNLQNRVLEEYSAAVLRRARAIKGVGYDLQRMIEHIGTYMKDQLHAKAMTTDQVFSVAVGADVPSGLVRVLQAAVGYGFLYPEVNKRPHRTDEDPLPEIGEETAELHLAYALAPLFRILPRRGEPRDLLSVLGQKLASELGSGMPKGPSLFDGDGSDLDA